MAKKQNTINHEPSGSVLYEKVGNKYIPVCEYFTTEYWRDGTYLVRIKPGQRQITSMVYLGGQDAALEAALQVVGDKVIKTIVNKTVTPKDMPKTLTKKQQEVFALWKEAFKQDIVHLPSIHEAILAGIAELREHIEKQRKY
jgi:hypothetical protein